MQRNLSRRELLRHMLLMGAAWPLARSDRAVARQEEVSVHLGEQETLLVGGSLGLEYFPDCPVIVLEQAPRLRLLVTAGVATYLVEGKSLERLERATRVLEPGPPGSFDNGYAGICGVHCHRDGALYACYHAEDQEDMPPIPGGIPGFFCSLGLARSLDGGSQWEKLGQIITSAKPKEWTAYPGQPDRGAGEAAFALSRDGRHLYLYYTEHSRQEGRGVQICMARAQIDTDPPLPGAWRKYHNGKFSEPGLGGLDTPVVSAKHLDDADAAMPFVAFSESLNRYIMVFIINHWKERFDPSKPKLSGIYGAYSQDGLHWSEPARLLADQTVAQLGRSVSWHPALIGDPGSSREGWLVYSHSERFGHRADGSGIPHYLVRRRIQFRWGREG